MLRIYGLETNEEYEMAKKLFVEYADSLDFDLDFQNFDKELECLPDQYCPPRGCILLAEHENQPAGCVALRPISDEICEMKRLYVKPKFRGLGIGRALAEAIVERARKIGYTFMRLDTVPAMKTARAIYQSLDFKQIDPYRFNPIDGAQFMELKLS